jgi:hypothetical protein
LPAENTPNIQRITYRICRFGRESGEPPARFFAGQGRFPALRGLPGSTPNGTKQESVFPGADRHNLLRTGRSLREISMQGRIMNESGIHYAYGPVPSRRLGKSLGINNIPAKVCS